MTFRTQFTYKIEFEQGTMMQSVSGSFSIFSDDEFIDPECVLGLVHAESMTLNKQPSIY